jgi:hypothetical protein
MQYIGLIRHAEKPIGGEIGLSFDSHPDPGGLSVRGWQRAGALAVRFGGPLRSAFFIPPTALYAAVDKGRSHRPRDTLLPLAELLGLPIIGLSSDDANAAAARIKSRAGNPLVCWRHRELPALARALMGNQSTSVPNHWDERRFDLMWMLHEAGLTEVPQRLLAGDRTT